MAGTITSAGIGSGLAVESIITQLMQLERQPITALQQRQSGVNTKLSALGQVKGALSALQTAADNIKTAAKFSVFKTEVGDAKVLTATAGSTATAAGHTVEVKNLASTQKLAAPGLANGSSTISQGTLTLELGTLDSGVYTADVARTYTINIDGTNNTLEGLRDAINALDADVSASIVNDGTANPARLVIGPKDSGASNVVRMSGLSGFDFDPQSPLTGSMEQTAEGKDALVLVDGLSIYSSSNVISDAIQGVTLNLKTSNDGSPTSLTVAQDNDAVKAKIEAFVKAYNDVNSNIRSLTSFNATTNTAGALNGDSTVRSVRDQLRQIASGDLAQTMGGFTRLSDAGISFAVDGSMTIDSTKLSAAIADPSKDIAGLFAGNGTTSGFAGLISDGVRNFLAADGAIASRTESFNQTIKGFTNRIDELESRMTRIEERYRRQYAALDTMVASMNSTGSFLAQQLTAFNNLNG